MRLIFSRKGFDSTAGGVPSPVVSGRPVSLPIPTRMPTPTRYCDVATGIHPLVEELTKGRIRSDYNCHLDPDLDEESLPRRAGWRGALGQLGAAQSHLAKNSVGPGDLFLFWGLFRTAAIDPATKRWHFKGPREHRIFGWMQIDEVLRVGPDPQQVLRKYPWLEKHPHAEPGWAKSNTIYIAREQLRLPSRALNQKGFGLFEKGYRLTSDASPRASTWSVPRWLNPRTGGVGMTYHPDSRWNSDGSLTAAGRGQEFVADIGERDDALDWVAALFGPDVA